MSTPIVRRQRSELQSRLCGIVPPLVTPLLDRDTIDRPGTERLIEHVIDGGVSGVFVLGTTGEAPSLSYRLRRELIRYVCELVAGRVPVLVGIADTSFIESVELAKVASEASADALVLTTPYYFPAGQTELLQYIASILKELPLPLILYNMPGLTKVWFEIDTLTQLAQHEQIIGVKDSSGDLGYYAQLAGLREQRPDWITLVGPEHLLAEAMKLGGDGGVNGGANCFPGLFTQWHRAILANDSREADALVLRVNQLQKIYEVGKYASRFIKATKSALSILGICSDRMAEPFNHFLPPERARVEAILKELLEMGVPGFSVDEISL